MKIWIKKKKYEIRNSKVNVSDGCSLCILLTKDYTYDVITSDIVNKLPMEQMWFAIKPEVYIPLDIGPSSINN